MLDIQQGNIEVGQCSGAAVPKRVARRIQIAAAVTTGSEDWQGFAVAEAGHSRRKKRLTVKIFPLHVAG